MSYANYQNWGGMLIRDAAPGVQANEIAIPYALSTVQQTEEMNFSFYKNNGDKVESVKGIRNIINTTIIGRSTADNTLLYNFFNTLNAKLNIGGLKQPLWIYPRYDSTKPINDVYAVFLTSGINPQDGSNVGSHQIFNLTFEGVNLTSRYSTNINLIEQTATVTSGGSPFNLIVTSGGSDYNLLFTSKG